MCGIVGYVGRGEALPFLLEGLRRLEYRGYDSAGVAVYHDGEMRLTKTAGRLEALERKLVEHPSAGTVGIGHTRWATHGRPTEENAHPHTDCRGTLAAVHNGIIENFAELRRRLSAAGHVFRSETDTEVLCHLVEEAYAGDLAAAVRRAARELVGSYAAAFLSLAEPHRLVAIRQDSPLVVGLGEGENYLASDIPAILARTRRAVILEERQVAVVRADGVEVTDLEGRVLGLQVFQVPWDLAQAEKGGLPTFMLKEIREQPRVLRETLRGRIEGERVVLGELEPLLAGVRKLHLVACGTAYHAGLVGKQLIEGLARLPVEVDYSSEFRYRNPILEPGTLCVAVSQSGETADTLAALREARRQGLPTLAVTNVVGSTLDREAARVLHTRAGPEIAVASTKAYTTQLAVMTLLALHLAQARGTLPAAQAAELVRSMVDLPSWADRVLDGEEAAAQVGRVLAAHRDVFFIGRGLDHALAMEGQLKLKEISYIHAEAYAAGELKHGPLALIEEGVPVVALATQPDLAEKLASNVQEVRARGGRIYAVAREGDERLANLADQTMLLPAAPAPLMPILGAIPLQLVAYHAALQRGCDVDKPRNLAKSVTVE